MKQNSKVSVIIPNFNYANFVGEAIESVLNQTYGDIEIVVVNNGSTDSSLEILDKYKNRICLVDQENLGQSGARNAGLARATGSYIAFLDADDYWEPKKLEMQIPLLDKSTELVYCGINGFRDGSQNKVSIWLPKFRGNCSSAFIEYPGVSIVVSGESTAVFTRSLLERVGGFDPTLNSAAGWDFFRRCSKFTNFEFVAEPLTNYRLHSNNMSNSSISTIADMRRAYKKLFEDVQWNVSSAVVRRTIRALEFGFFKTNIKNRNFGEAMHSGLRMNGFLTY